MLHFILGESHSGKSTRFLSLFQQEHGNLGLYSEKLYENEVIIGYNLVLLPIKKQLPFIKRKESLSTYDIEQYYQQGRFVFLKETFLEGERYILDHLTSNNTVWIDEIGGLELKGLGYDALLSSLINKNVDLVLTVRTSLFSSVLERYQITEYQII